MQRDNGKWAAGKRWRDEGGLITMILDTPHTKWGKSVDLALFKDF